MKNAFLILVLVLVGCADGADVDVTADEQALQTGDASCSTSDGSPCFCGTAGCDGDPASGGGGTGGGGGGGGGGLCTVQTVCNTGWWCQRAAACWDDDYYPRTGYRERYCAQQTTCLGITTTGPAYSDLVLDMAMCEVDEC